MKKNRKIIYATVLTAFQLLLFVSYGQCACKSYCVIENLSGRVLSADNEHMRSSVASTTKIMTAIIAIEQGELDDTVIISEKAANTEGSSAYLNAGDTVSLKDLILFTLLRSANDASVAIAESISGSEEAFVKTMNKYAAHLKLSNTLFENPHGLDSANHFSSAYDLCVLFRYAMQNELFYEIICLHSAKVKINGNAKTIINKRTESNYYDIIFASKNGFTENAGKCLVSAAHKNNMTLIGTVLDSADIYGESSGYFEKCFNDYKFKKIISKGEYIRTIPVEKGKTDTLNLLFKKDYYVPIKENETATLMVNVPEKLFAPVKVKTRIGESTVYINGQSIFTIPHYASLEIPIKNYELIEILKRFKGMLKSLF